MAKHTSLILCGFWFTNFTS